jgi:hypothetical protein
LPTAALAQRAAISKTLSGCATPWRCNVVDLALQAGGRFGISQGWYAWPVRGKRW